MSGRGAWTNPSVGVAGTRKRFRAARERKHAGVPAVRNLSPARRCAAHSLIVILCLPFVLPLLWMVSTSLKADKQIVATGTGGTVISLGNLVPDPVKWNNYVAAVLAAPMGIYLKNKVLLCAVTAVGAVASSAVVAYGSARMRFRGRDSFFLLMIGTLALPSQVTMIPVESVRATGEAGRRFAILDVYGKTRPQALSQP